MSHVQSSSGWLVEFDFTPVLSAVSAVVLFYVGLKIVKVFIGDGHIPIRDPSKTHSWRSSNSLLNESYCNICSQLILTGDCVYCDCCGIYCDIVCTSKANKDLPCKIVSSLPEVQLKHHWIKGNLPFNSICDVCKSDCGNDGLSDFKCCWCLRTVHNNCKKICIELCDFGVYKSLIIPPSCIEVVRTSKKLVLKSIRHPGWMEWTPLLVVANSKSGSKDGANILSLFRGVLNPMQVVDLTSTSAEAALEPCHMINTIPTNVLVCGGDGTVGWMLNSIHKLNFKVNPAVAILPLGTGNDLSRVLGWGAETSSSEVCVTKVLDSILNAHRVQFDRWNVCITPYRSLSFKSKVKQLYMYNYLSIGVDAQVTLDFHRARESPFYIFSSRIFNKLLYLGYGTQQIIEKKCQGLEGKLELYLDGSKVVLPSIEAIVVLNIDSWGAGVKLWQMSSELNEPEQSFSDRKLEVLAIYSSLHIGQLQVGLSVPHRIGQANQVLIKLKSPTAVQVDGEPWEQHPAEFTITHYNQTVVLRNMQAKS